MFFSVLKNSLLYKLIKIFFYFDTSEFIFEIVREEECGFKYCYFIVLFVIEII